MTEQRAGWLQRLVGADGKVLTALEQQLQQVQDELGREREERARLDQELALSRDLAAVSEQGFESKLRAAQASLEERQTSQEALELRLKQSVDELQITREELGRQRDASSKLTKSLAATNAQLERAERAAQESRTRLTELEDKLADSLRRLQGREQRSSILEHELAQTQLALKSAETELQVVATRAAKADRERSFAVAVGEESWRALGHVLGEASTLALSLGVDAGPVKAGDSLPDAAAALRLALEGWARRCSHSGLRRGWDAAGAEGARPRRGGRGGGLVRGLREPILGSVFGRGAVRGRNADGGGGVESTTERVGDGEVETRAPGAQ